VEVGMRKKALCIGINDYGHLQAPEWNVPDMNMRGALNDAYAWANLLVRHHDFSVADVELLLDADATRANILKGFKELVAGSRRGDVLVFTNSSHGTLTPDVSGDEEEIDIEVHGRHFKGRFDQAICPYDYPKLVIDDELKEISDGVADGVNLTVISDSCFSGTLTDFKPSPAELRKYSSFRGPEIITLSGCSDRQLSGDLRPDESRNRYDWHGFMTYNAIETIKNAGYRLTYAELHEKILDRIKNADDPTYDKYRDQHPHLEANEESKQLYIFTTERKKGRGIHKSVDKAK
jgi:metacaspase-1